MKLEGALRQKSHLYFIVFFLFVLIAFWLTYFVNILGQESYRMHTHGITLILWCLMLIIQPYLIRTKRYDLHRRIGKVSYFVVPLIIITTIDLLKFTMKKLQQLGPMDYFFVALVVNALVAFLILYGLAIFNKDNANIHARLMVCTAFPMFTPITDRIIHIYFPSVLPYLPVIESTPIAPSVGFMLADLLLLALCIWDWVSHRRWNVFPFALILLLSYHYSVFNFYKFECWRNFSDWLVGF